MQNNRAIWCAIVALAAAQAWAWRANRSALADPQSDIEAIKASLRNHDTYEEEWTRKLNTDLEILSEQIARVAPGWNARRIHRMDAAPYQ